MNSSAKFQFAGRMAILKLTCCYDFRFQIFVAMATKTNRQLA